MKKFTQLKYKLNEQEISLSTGSEVIKTDGKSIVTASELDNHEMDSQDSNKLNETETSSAGKFLSKMFESREMAHVYHLQVKGESGSYASHIALNDYYENILDLIDELAETYMGQYDIINDYQSIDTNGTNSKDKLEYFKELSEFIKSNRTTSFSPEDTHLQNIIDEMVSIVYRTTYKLKFMK